MDVVKSIISNLSSFFLPSSLWPIPKVVEENQSPSLVIEIIKTFLEDMNHCPPDSPPDVDEAINQSLSSDSMAYDGNNAVWFERICREASAVAKVCDSFERAKAKLIGGDRQLCYPAHSAEVQLQIARFTWYMFYFDDLCHQFPSTIETFQRRVLVNDTFEEPILQSFRDNLTDTYRFWDSIPANCIILSAMEYFNGCALEERPTIRDMKLLDTAESWPYYLRNKTGVAAAYAFMIYPKDSNSDVSAYIQAMGDMCFFINVVNDLLSFHKEQLAGETNNYVHIRARITRKSIQDTLRDVAKESSAAHARIMKILQFTDGATAWKRFVDGYLTLHLTQSRFRLNELGF